MSRRDRTRMGGDRGVFQTTQWSVVLDAGATDASQRQEAMDRLVSVYWKPAYCYLRQWGHDNETAKDLTQDFFCDVVIRRNLPRAADPAKGRFRTLLLTALKRYARTAHRDARAKKRAPAGAVVRIDAFDCPDIPEDVGRHDPEAAFRYAFVTEVLDQVLAGVKQDCAASGLAVHWEVFRERVLNPVFDDEPAPTLTEVCARFDIENEAKVSNMIVTVKRRLQKALRDAIQEPGQPRYKADEGIGELLAMLGGSRAR